MKSSSRLAVWLVLIGLVCLTLVSCKLGSFVLQQVTPTLPPTNTPLPTAVPPTETPTQPPPPTDTPLPPPTEVPTAIPLPTDTPLPTAVPPTDTPSLSLVTVVNNLNQMINISLAGPANKTFSVRAHSEYTFETPPGQYTYHFEARNFLPDTGYVTFEPGPFTWTFGKAQD